MRRIGVFNQISLDGFICDPKGDMSWAHNLQPDPEWANMVSENAGSESVLMFGRVTYEMMASYWPTPMAAQNSPGIAERMNSLQKVVFSRTLDETSWSNSRLLKGDLLEEARKFKTEEGPDATILGSGSIVSQLAAAGLIDEFQVVVNPVAIGKGKTMFDTVSGKLALRRTGVRAFGNGNVILTYEPVS